MEQKQIYKAIAQVWEEVAFVEKKKKTGTMQYDTKSAVAFIKKIRPVFKTNGIIIHPSSMRVVTSESIHTTKYDKPAVFNRVVIEMTLRFVHVKSGEFIEVFCGGEGVDPMDKSINKAQTVALKYGVEMALYLASSDDPDNPEDDAPPATIKKKKSEPTTSNINDLNKQYVVNNPKIVKYLIAHEKVSVTTEREVYPWVIKFVKAFKDRDSLEAVKSLVDNK